MIGGNFPAVSNFNRFICNQPPVLPDHGSWLVCEVALLIREHHKQEGIKVSQIRSRLPCLPLQHLMAQGVHIQPTKRERERSIASHSMSCHGMAYTSCSRPDPDGRWAISDPCLTQPASMLTSYVSCICTATSSSTPSVLPVHKIWYLVLETLNTNTTLNITNSMKVSNTKCKLKH